MISFSQEPQPASVRFARAIDWKQPLATGQRSPTTPPTAEINLRARAQFDLDAHLIALAAFLFSPYLAAWIVTPSCLRLREPAASRRAPVRSKASNRIYSRQPDFGLSSFSGMRNFQCDYGA